MQRRKKGFTLIEMLVVIAIVAILVVMVIPTVQTSTKKSKAAADAANLRGLLGEANVVIFGGNKTVSQSVEMVKAEGIKSKSFPNADLYIVYTVPGFIDVYFVEGGTLSGDDISGGTFYGLDYLSELAEKGETEVSTEKPTFPAGYDPVWHLLSDNG